MASPEDRAALLALIVLPPRKALARLYDWLGPIVADRDEERLAAVLCGMEPADMGAGLVIGALTITAPVEGCSEARRDFSRRVRIWRDGVSW